MTSAPSDRRDVSPEGGSVPRRSRPRHAARQPARPSARYAARALVVALSALLLGWLPSVASAASQLPTDDLPGHTGTFTAVDGILVFGVAPVGVFLLITLIVMRPGSAPRAQRYRPGRDWTAEPSWSGLQPAAGTARLDPAGQGSAGQGSAGQRSAGHGQDPSALPVGGSAVPVMDGVPAAVEHADPTAPGDSGHATGRGDRSGQGGASGGW